MNSDNRLEKIGLLILAALAIVTLAIISFKALSQDTVDPNAATMIGVIITGLIAFGKDIIQAIRGYAMSAQLGKVTDQLAASGPVADPANPQPVTVTNDEGNPVPITEQKP